MKFNRSLYRRMIRQSGFSIMEVLIGIAIFAIGMLALAALQGALTRSTTEAKTRTEAVNIAEEIIEAQRGFSSVLATSGVLDYGDIRSSNDADNPWTSHPLVITRNNVTYNVTQEVRDYYYASATDSFTETKPTGATTSDYKSVTVNVAWGDDREFVIQEGVETTGNLGGGSVQLSSIISVESIASIGRVAAESDQPLISPPVAYTPGLRPDVIALALGESKFKEALTPEPEVVRNDELVKTTFEVVTYSTSNGNEFLRREEFVAVPCECRLKGTGSGRRPVIWAGDEYVGGHFVQKPYGEPANPNKTSLLCETCCRDHHDGGSTQAGDSADEYSNVYGPFKKGVGNDKEYAGAARKSDHLHYQSDGKTVAGLDDEYLEVCRMVRVDGFLSVAQDFRREDQYVFPADFLDFDDPGDTEIDTYSSYITNAVLAYQNDVALTDYPPAPPCIGIPVPSLAGDPTCVAVPSMQNSYPVPRGSTELPSWTALQTSVLDEQQLRSRGIYIDYISQDLRKFISSCITDAGALVNDCCIRGGAVATQCTGDDLYMDKTGSSNILEILPFFEVQLTKLENWNQDPPMITLTNQAIADANTHLRGDAIQLVTGNGNNTTISLGTTEAEANSHRGNIGFTNTLAIDKEFPNQLKQGILDVHSLDASGGGSTGSGPTLVVLLGQFTEFVTGDPTIIVSGGGDATCSLTPGGYYCFYPVNPTSPTTITVEGYEDNNGLEIRCAVSNTLIRTGGDNTYTTFSLLDSVGGALPTDVSYDINIQWDGCGGGGPGT